MKNKLKAYKTMLLTAMHRVPNRYSSFHTLVAMPLDMLNNKAYCGFIKTQPG